MTKSSTRQSSSREEQTEDGKVSQTLPETLSDSLTEISRAVSSNTRSEAVLGWGNQQMGRAEIAGTSPEILMKQSEAESELALKSGSVSEIDSGNITGKVAAEWDEDAFVVHLDGFEGPLDMLLQLARTQKVDLTRISILQLVEQYLRIIESARKIRLELAADWLVMAAWLAWLKSCLLLPQRPDEAEDTEQAVDILQERLEALEQVSRAAEWMQHCSLLGHEVFKRGYYEDCTAIDSSGLVLDSSRFIDAYIRIMRRKTGKKAWRIRSFQFWTVRDALSRLKRLLGAGKVPGWQRLDAFLPEYELQDRQQDLSPEQQERQWKAAWSGTLLAGLELAKLGEIRLSQEKSFGQIRLQAQGKQGFEKSEKPEKLEKTGMQEMRKVKERQGIH